MNVSTILKFVQSLPETVRSVLYVIYLLTYFIKSMKTFFIPKRPRFVPEEQFTVVPRETPDGIVHEVLSDSDIHERYSADDAMSFDPVNLANNGIEPKTFGGSVVSPFDATQRIVDSFDGLDSSLFSTVESSSSDSSVNTDSSSSTNND